MHFCTAHVAIGGDNRNVMYRDEFAPVSWPEVEVLREVHGPEAVTEVIPFVDVRQTARAERDRLVRRYGEEVMAARWGGKNSPDELKAAGARLRANVVWRNPLSNHIEITGPGGQDSSPYTIPEEQRTAVEVVGNYAVRDAAVVAEAEANDPYSEYHQPTDEELAAQEPVPFEEPVKPSAKKKAPA